MSTHVTEDLNVAGHQPLPSPVDIKSSLPLDERGSEIVDYARDTIKAILNRTDPRLLIVVGPCSIHDPKAAIEYGERLKELSDAVDRSLFVVMRTYFEKPRTTTGWKGLINDPDLNDTFDIERGIRVARKLMLDLTELGLPLATEALDPVTPQYLHDLIAWSAIGARTTESQTHREIASGLSSVVGFKNATDGRLDVATNALKSVVHPHRFLGINSSGQVSIIQTRGNPHGHIVLRGGTNGPNYRVNDIEDCEAALQSAGQAMNIMIDCSHANANKDHTKQPQVVDDVCEQILQGNESIMGLMLESHLHAGNQSIPDNHDDLSYGVSITDACIDWDTTDALLRDLDQRLYERLTSRSNADSPTKN